MILLEQRVREPALGHAHERPESLLRTRGLVAGWTESSSFSYAQIVLAPRPLGVSHGNVASERRGRAERTVLQLFHDSVRTARALWHAHGD